MPSPSNLFLQQLSDLQNRVAELSEKGQLNELTRAEVGLLNYALGGFTGQLLLELQAVKKAKKARASK